MANRGKLRLDVDQLEVETFGTDAAASTRGTVRGHDPYDTASGDFAGCACDTRYNTCWGGCGPSQQATCPGQPGCQENETEYLTCSFSCGWEGGQAVLFPNC
jgi:hypothetical protein